MAWRVLERSGDAVFLVSLVAGGCVVAVSGLVWGAATDGAAPWNALWTLVWLPVSFGFGLAIWLIARVRYRRTDAAAPPRETVDDVDEEGPLPPGAQALDFRTPEAWPFVRGSAVAGLVIGIAEPGPTSVGAVVGVTIVVIAGLVGLGMAMGLVSGLMTANDGLVAMAFGDRGDAAFMRASGPAFAAVGVGAALYILDRYGLIPEDALNIAIAVALVVLVPPMLSLALVGRPRALLPFFYRELGGQQRLWDAIPDPPYERKNRTRRSKSRRGSSER